LPEATLVLAECGAEKRATDKSWLTVNVEGEPLLLFLLPLTGLDGAVSFAQRIDGLIRARCGGLLPDAYVQTKVHEIQRGESVESLLSFGRTSPGSGVRDIRVPANRLTDSRSRSVRHSPDGEAREAT
jgi:hypothetical protein